MTSVARQKILYTSFLSGLALSLLVIILSLYLRPYDNPSITLAVQSVAASVVALASGLILRNELKRSYLVATIALFYTYALSLLLVVTQYVHYGLFMLLVAVITVVSFYISNKFFNRVHFNEFIKLLIVSIGFIALFIVCSDAGVYIIRTVIPITN